MPFRWIKKKQGKDKSKAKRTQIIIIWQCMCISWPKLEAKGVAATYST